MKIATAIPLSDAQAALVVSLLWAHCERLGEMLQDEEIRVSRSALEASLASAEDLAKFIQTHYWY